MNWLSNLVRPKIKSLTHGKDVPDNLWRKCPQCDAMIFAADADKNLNVCQHCNYHMRINVSKRLELLFDGGKYKREELAPVKEDPLQFKDKKKYKDRLKEYRAKTGEQDAIIVAKGKIGGVDTVVFALNFTFMGGSMGTAVGEGVVKACELAVKSHCPLLGIPASGGARMQEGVLSLMQMPRTTVAVKKLKEEGLPYVVLLTDPTTGGVSASFAMLGDIHIAEPGTMIGFAGKRVIKETIRENLPKDFQTAEYLHAHGMVDMVIDRKDLSTEIGKLFDLIMNHKK
jgi:acetyl-CoA carboxylase carboxyl transferase subunit beta